METATLWRPGTFGSVDIDLASLAANAANVGAAIDNSVGNLAAKIFIRLFTGTAPTLGTRAEIYFYSRDNHASPIVTVDGWTGAKTSGVTVNNAKLLDSVRFLAAGNSAMTIEIDTLNALRFPLPPSWSIGVWNRTNQAFNATPANFAVRYAYYNPLFQN